MKTRAFKGLAYAATFLVLAGAKWADTITTEAILITVALLLIAFEISQLGGRAR